MRLGQGRQNATAFLREHPDVCDGILRAVQNELGPDAIVSSRLLPVDESAKAAPRASDPEDEDEVEAKAEKAAAAS